MLSWPFCAVVFSRFFCSSFLHFPPVADTQQVLSPVFKLDNELCSSFPMLLLRYLSIQQELPDKALLCFRVYFIKGEELLSFEG